MKCVLKKDDTSSSEIHNGSSHGRSTRRIFIIVV
ncbi:hypothetical protein BVRB_1g015300 [Beta vulgaris subsp. vulgaris]|nr:hypothetical protein BVRB_1g015300 [Beta vulgaris subsp. vulgaris]